MLNAYHITTASRILYQKMIFKDRYDILSELHLATLEPSLYQNASNRHFLISKCWDILKLRDSDLEKVISKKSRIHRITYSSWAKPSRLTLSIAAENTEREISCEKGLPAAERWALFTYPIPLPGGRRWSAQHWGTFGLLIPSLNLKYG